jgi:hypothetical protein
MNEKMLPTKLLILADDDGKVLAAYVPGLREGNVPQVSIIPQAGQVVREVQSPEDPPALTSVQTPLASIGFGSPAVRQRWLSTRSGARRADAAPL